MTIQIAGAPVSWGIYEFEGAVQRFTVSDVLDGLVQAGFTGLEYGPWGFLPSDPEVLKPELSKRGLSLLSSFVPVKLVDANAHEVALQHALKVGRVLAACGAEYLVLADDNGTVPELVANAGRRRGLALGDDAWKVVAAGVNRIARVLRDELGLTTVFHHHGAGYVETVDETYRLMDETEPDLVGLCLDTGHWHFTGGDAVDCIRTLGERVRYLHLKDCDPAIRDAALAEGLDYFGAIGRGMYCELGLGEVDFAGVLGEAEKLGYSGWAIVEQDVLTDDLDYPLAAATRNRQYLRKLGY